MFSLVRTLRQRTLQSLQCRRMFAQVVDTAPSVDSVEASVPVTSSTVGAVDWRKGRIPVQEDHGLYAFFRRKEPKDNETLKGDARFEVLESPNDFEMRSGRGWRAEELRLKCFKDLHVLWYVLLRERNLLSTQREEARRMGVIRQLRINVTKLYHVRKSMARIKTVLNERRLAYDQAMNIVQTERDAHHDQRVLEHLRKEYSIRTRREARAAKLAKAAAVEKQAEENRTKNKTPQEVASLTAAAGLFGNSQQ